MSVINLYPIYLVMKKHFVELKEEMINNIHIKIFHLSQYPEINTSEILKLPRNLDFIKNYAGVL